LDLELLGCFLFYLLLCSYDFIILIVCVCKVVAVIMDREEWMYKIPRVSGNLSFLGHVRKFVAAAKKHCLSLGRSTPFVHEIAARTSLSWKMTWCNLT
jgi:hypothetical protein